MSYLGHQNHEKAKAEVKKAFGLSYLAGMLYWIPVMSINFVYFTPQHRVLFIAIGSFVEMNGEIFFLEFHFSFSKKNTAFLCCSGRTGTQNPIFGYQKMGRRQVDHGIFFLFFQNVCHI